MKYNLDIILNLKFVNVNFMYYISYENNYYRPASHYVKKKTSAECLQVFEDEIVMNLKYNSVGFKFAGQHNNVKN